MSVRLVPIEAEQFVKRLSDAIEVARDLADQGSPGGYALRAELTAIRRDLATAALDGITELDWITSPALTQTRIGRLFNAER